ncbi:MAG TPA: DUF3459 domain-containing protein, partial [Candidatus Didemnitutus sp.]|nr:DUF3459 domain-containing protein [Candidatus Didemnitutus sp.]
GMRQLVLDNATMWLRDYGFDGLRLDAVHAIFDQRAVHILEELADHVKLLGEESGRHFVVIAESDLHDPRLVRPRALGGYGLDAFWADDFHHAVHRFLTGETDRYYADFNGLADIARAIREGYVYQGQYAPSRHRSQGRPPGALATAQLVFCIQNHDQIGNRAAGERLGMLVSPAKARAAATLLLLAPQVPLLFQGEEWAASTPFLYFTDHADPELGRAVTEGRRREFPSEVPVPDPQAADTFQRSQLQWTERELPRHSEMLGWYRRLIALRKKIRHAPCEVQCDAAAGWLTLRRGPVLALFNFSELAQPVPVPEGKWRLVLSSGPEQAMAGSVPSLTTWVLALEMWEGAPFAEGAVN